MGITRQTARIMLVPRHGLARLAFSQLDKGAYSSTAQRTYAFATAASLRTPTSQPLMHPTNAPRCLTVSHGRPLLVTIPQLDCPRGHINCFTRTLMTENNHKQEPILKYSGSGDDFISPQEYKIRVGSAIRTLREELPLFFQQGLCTTSIYASNVRLIEASHTNVSLQGKPIYFLLAGAIRWSFKMWFRDIEFEIQSIRVNDRGSRGLKGMDSGSDFDDTSASAKMKRSSSTSLATSLSRSPSSVSSSASSLDLDLQPSWDAVHQKSGNGFDGLVKLDSGAGSAATDGGGAGGEPPLPATTVTVRWTMKGTTRPSVVLTSSGPTSPPPSSFAGIFVYTFNDYGLIDEHRIENIMPSPSPEAIQRAFAWWGWLLSKTRPAATATAEEPDTRKRLGLGCIVHK